MASKGTLLAVDVGGTDIKSALLSADAERPSALSVLTRLRRPTPRAQDGTSTAKGIVATVAELVAELGAQSPTGGIDAVGVVVPGVVDAGVGVFSANLGWRDFPFAAALGEAIEAPVVFGHDVGAGGVAEHRMGAARGCRDAVVMPIGTGIAAALIMDGEGRTGGGYAGEIGHVDIGHQEPCGCGRTGCLEAIASTSAIARRYGRRVGRQIAGAAEVLAAANAGDADAAAVWTDALDGLAKGIAVLATLLGPERVVLGGGLAMAGTALTDPLTERIAGLLTFQRRPELRIAELGDEAGCLGAGFLALQRWSA
ncbi:MAG TPA: ROK family protein [Pseudonocardiaceae bacterium]|nr:ROK family protein [Pseudonocardiaceae bacterium]